MIKYAHAIEVYTAIVQRSSYHRSNNTAAEKLMSV